ncbi:DNA-processing protein DprA [Desulfogranum japonicum]|uniref:DNA-processing protein DprA n=1 Tax=Desulfogranum japonicum TaxID=231447 RepID=UPI0003FDED45|nr:DNA-processing protein DprA [Desulfogranum japonicum]
MHICSHAIEWLTLLFLDGLGTSARNRLVQHCKSPGELLEESWLETAGLAPRVLNAFKDRSNKERALERAKHELEALSRNHCSLIGQCCSLYPEELKNIADPPLLLYAVGDLQSFRLPRVAIVGSRSATSYGKRISATLAKDLSLQGICVVSGGAYGVDAQAHRGALAAGGRTICVFGCGVNVTYPQEHRDLYAQIKEKGVLLSEFPLGSKPSRFHFPMRNRIISGISKGIVVVEATEKSGSLITARLALDQGRDVFAVPGRIDSAKSRGCHRLIQTGAFLAQNAGEIVTELQLFDLHETELCRRQEASGDHGQALSPGAQKLLEKMEPYPLSIDVLGRSSGYSAIDLPGLLLELELAGVIRQLPGQLYELVSLS